MIHRIAICLYLLQAVFGYSQNKAIYVMDFEDADAPSYERIDYGLDVFFTTKDRKVFMEDLFYQIDTSAVDDILISIHGMWGSDSGNFKRTASQINDAYLFHDESDIDQIIYVKWPVDHYLYRDNRQKTKELAPYVYDYFFEFMKMMEIIKGMSQRDIRIHVMCHSLGNYLLSELMRLSHGDDFVVPFVDHLIMAAADLPTYVFEGDHPMTRITQMAKQVTVYINRSDLTLKISEELNDIKRLGRSGPSPLTVLSDHISIVDVTEINDERSFGDRLSSHSYHRNSPVVAADIRELLSDDEHHDFSHRISSQTEEHCYLLQYPDSEMP